MKTRITKNEEKLDEILASLKELEKSINHFEEMVDKLKELNAYYGSKEWFKDKDNFEKGKIKNIKAGVLSEDTVWNVNEKVEELNLQMKEIINRIKQERK